MTREEKDKLLELYEKIHEPDFPEEAVVYLVDRVKAMEAERQDKVVPKGYELKLEKLTPKEGKLPYFRKIADITCQEHEVDMDIFDILINLSPAEGKLFQLIKSKHFRKNNLSTIPAISEEFPDKNNLYKLLRRLEETTLVKKVPARLVPREKNHLVVLLNPRLIIPFDKNLDAFNEALELWEKL